MQLRSLAAHAETHPDAPKSNAGRTIVVFDGQVVEWVENVWVQLVGYVLVQVRVQVRGAKVFGVRGCWYAGCGLGVGHGCPGDNCFPACLGVNRATWMPLPFHTATSQPTSAHTHTSPYLTFRSPPPPPPFRR